MKKLFTLLLLTLAAFTLKSTAQTTNCSADFSFSLSGLSVTFTPVITSNLSSNHNFWRFGDGSVSSEIVPVHAYSAAGAYTVTHIYYRTETGVPNAVCIDSVQKRVEIAASTLSCNLHAAFSYQRDSSQSNKIYFHNLSTPANDIKYVKWSFGDGASSNDFNASHTYTISGLYTVCLSIVNNTATGCYRDTCFKVQVQVSTPPTCDFTAYFAWHADSVHLNNIHFTNSSTHFEQGDSIRWTFGDGTSSTDVNPSHTYTASGTYNVCIRVQKKTQAGTTPCVREYCKQVVVQVPPPPCDLTAYFAWHADSMQLSKIHFINFSTHFAPGDSIRWTFGDGTSSNDINPSHEYAAAGTYNVCIRVQKKTAAGTAPCVREYCKQVVVVNECRLEANFNFEADATNKNKIYFKNSSTPLSSVIYVQWSFGDGTSSNSINPDHVYAHPGVYTVCLKISTSNTCYREICKTVEIKEPEINCLEISKFTVTRSTVNCLESKFVPAVQNANWKYVWTFGDGTGSTQMSPSHVYPRSGNYTAFLTVYRSATCVSTSYKVAETGACFSCNNIWVKYEYQRTSSLSNTLYFHALSNYPILSQSWTITKLTISGSATVTLGQLNPVYTFNEPGDYRVCLRVITQGQCVKEYCDVIHISSPNTACTLTAYPNPATNAVSLNVALTSPEMIHVYVFNSLNVLVKQKEQQGATGNNIVTTNLEGLVPGWYTIKVIYGYHVCYSKFQKI